MTKKQKKEEKNITGVNECAKKVLAGKSLPTETTKTIKVRVKDRHKTTLRRLTPKVNAVWNYANELTGKAWRRDHKFLSGFDMTPLVKGASQCEEFNDLLQASINEIVQLHAEKRNTVGRSQLRFRVSKFGHPKYSRGWIPFKIKCVRWKDGKVHYGRFAFGLMEDGYDMAGFKFRAGTFNEDSRGRWFCNISVKVPIEQKLSGVPIGIDPGRQTVVTASTGDKLPLSAIQYKDLEDKLAIAQRANKKKRVQAIHNKIANKRKYALYAYANLIVSKASIVIIGNWAPAAEGKVPGAKNARAGSLATFKQILAHKCEMQGVPLIEINEAYTSKSCSGCGTLTEEISGVEGLGVRRWTCEHCGVTHDRDVNAAKNICEKGLIDMKDAGVDITRWTVEPELREATQRMMNLPDCNEWQGGCEAAGVSEGL